MAMFDKYKRRLRLFAQYCWHWGLRGAAVITLGAVAACGFRPLGLWPLTLLGVAGLIWLVGRATHPKWAALMGWLWGVGHFTLGNNWIATAFTYQAKMPVWLGGVVLSVHLCRRPMDGAAALGAGDWARRAVVDRHG